MSNIAFPASRFTDEAGRTIYTKVTRNPWGQDLTWRNARGIMVWLGRHCRYLPLFFWRPVA